MRRSEASTAASSQGWMLRRSSTSASIPSRASASAARSTLCTMAP
ncbi:Uncharacterised protein [Bordetella pertussis]|nr:Uncharacterised protein [Bordetella pertussis]